MQKTSFNYQNRKTSLQKKKKTQAKRVFSINHIKQEKKLK